MVFIDAAKLEYPQYIRCLLEKLEEFSVIITDNIFYDDKIFNENILKHDGNSIRGIKEYIDFITNNTCFKSHFLNIGDGIAISFYTSKINLCSEKNKNK
jgi:predicted O-methyltransferase YrrM